MWNFRVEFVYNIGGCERRATEIDSGAPFFTRLIEWCLGYTWSEECEEIWPCSQVLEWKINDYRANHYTILVWAWLRGEFKAGLPYIFLSIHDTFKETTN